MIITVPGTVWEDALNPLATAMQLELGLPEPRCSRIGFGWRYTYVDVEPTVARDLAIYLMDRADLMLAQDIDDRSVFYKMRTVGNQIYLKVGS